jgi:hypothetical protein
MLLIRASDLPGEALAAAAAFHVRVLPQVLAALVGEADCLTLVFPTADHSHRAWRLAAVQGLAREHALLRVNGVESADEAAISAAQAYLATAPGVTGQYLPLDAAGATGA